MGRWWIVTLTLAVLIAAASRLSWLGRPFYNDAGLYIAIGKVVAGGGRFYRDIWDTKLPSVALLMWPQYVAFGDRWWAYVVSQLLLGLGAAAIVARIVDRYVGRSAARFTLAFALLAFNSLTFTGSGLQLETFQLFFASLAALFYLRAYLAEGTIFRIAGFGLLSGLAGGAAAMAKPTSLGVIACCLVTVVVYRRALPARRAMALAVAILVGVVVVAAVNLAALPRVADTSQLTSAWHEIRLYASGTPWHHLASPKVLVLAAAALGPCVCCALAGRRSFPMVSPLVLFASLWLSAELAGIVVQKRAYSYHFLPILSPIALLVGIAVGRVPTRQVVWAYTLGLVPLVTVTLTALAGQRRYLFVEHDPIYAVSEKVRSLTAPDESVFADPLGALVLLADRPPGARLGMMIGLLNHDDAPRTLMDQLIADLEERKPVVIVVPGPAALEERLKNWESQPILRDNPERRRRFRDAWRRFLAYVDAHYAPPLPVGGSDVRRRTA